MSHIQQQRELFEANRKKVQSILKWDDLTYTTFQYEAAYDYLRDGMGLEDMWVDYLTLIPQFWRFWVNQWNLRDAHSFLPNASKINRTPTEVYQYIHSARFINAHPSKSVFEEAYARMIGETIDFHQAFKNADKYESA